MTAAGAQPSSTDAARRATGTVTEVGAVADASSGVASYPVTIAFTDTSGDFYVGADVDGRRSPTREVEDVVQVPAFAVTTTNGTSTVTVSSGRHDGDAHGHDRADRPGAMVRDHERARGR